MATITKRVLGPRAAVQYAQDVSETPRVSLTSITLTFGGNGGGNGVVVWNDASTASLSSLRSHNRVILDAAAQELLDANAGGSDNADELSDFEFTGTRIFVEELVAGSVSVGGGAAGAGTFASLTLTAAASKIIPGATSLSLRNNTDSADNLLITNAGDITARLSFHSLGKAGLGIAVQPNAGVATGGDSTNLTGASQVGLYVLPECSSGATTEFVGLRVEMYTAAASYTIVLGEGLRIIDPSKGSGSAITTLIGLAIDSMTSGATNYAIKTGTGAVDFGDSVNIASGKVYKVNATQVVAARITGWSAATNTKSKATFDTTTVTTAALAARVGQLLDDLITHGLIGA
jgi:hypothetical protein